MTAGEAEGGSTITSTFGITSEGSFCLSELIEVSELTRLEEEPSACLGFLEVRSDLERVWVFSFLLELEGNGDTLGLGAYPGAAP